VIYTTSFHGVRSTCEECKYVVSVFHNLRVRVEEKDIYVHKFYHNELEERLQKRGVAVPQVFVGGQHIGVSELLTCTHIYHSHAVFSCINLLMWGAEGLDHLSPSRKVRGERWSGLIDKGQR